MVGTSSGCSARNRISIGIGYQRNGLVIMGVDPWHTCSNEAAPYLKYYVAGKDESRCRGSWHLAVYPKRGRQKVPGMTVSPDRTRLEALREAFREDGYVIVRGLLGEEELQELRRAIETPLIQQ